MNNAITVSCELPGHLSRNEQDKDAAEVYVSRSQNAQRLKPGTSKYFPLERGHWIIVRKISNAPVRIINNMKQRVQIEETTDDGDDLDDVLDPRQSRALTNRVSAGGEGRVKITC